jgi:2,3-dihydroxybiphenyl 1,2-dioxygenase
VQAIGWDAGDEGSLDALVARIEAAGYAVAPCSPAEAQARRVARLWHAHDPAGNRVELFHGLEAAATAFESPAFPGRFRTGELGFGHAVLVHDDLEAMEAFYTGALGFGVTERLDTKVGPIHVRGTFLHCNARHHSLALFDLPSRKRLHHFMLEANDPMDVGRAFERAEHQGVPISLDLGQHPHPDGTFSFYGTTPAGFDFEIGAGAGLIEPQAWSSTATATTSSWGHKPRMRLKLRAVRDLASRALS